ncbi:SPOR domain-containing protein [Desulfonatronum parangueonense]
MIGAGMVGILIMAWAFILGILVGRGYNPESVIPEIGRIITPQTSAITSAPPRTVLQPEELRFFETLQERASQPAPTAPPRNEPPARPQAQQHIQQQPATRIEQPQPLVQAPPAEPTPAPVPSLGPQYEFVFQVASFQNDGQARSLQQRISSAGIPATVEAGTVEGRQWYRVLVTVRGAQTDANHIKSQLQGLGIENPFLRAKKSL